MKRVAGPALTTSDPAKIQTPAIGLRNYGIIAKHYPLRNIGKGNSGSHRQNTNSALYGFSNRKGPAYGKPLKIMVRKSQGHAEALAFSS